MDELQGIELSQANKRVIIDVEEAEGEQRERIGEKQMQGVDRIGVVEHVEPVGRLLGGRIGEESTEDSPSKNGGRVLFFVVVTIVITIPFPVVILRDNK